jgi:hypothetical protein
MGPGPWAPLWSASLQWRGALPGVAAAAGALPGDEPWRSAVLLRGSELCRALRTEERSSALAAAASLAGLGEGSTPAGDDYLMGVLHAAWATDLAARTWAPALAAAAAPRTTTASAVWLAAAARGQVAPAWGELLAALAGGDSARLVTAVAAVRARGHTSGAYSLRGFLAACPP